jgi:hypothetical protein
MPSIMIDTNVDIDAPKEAVWGCPDRFPEVQRVESVHADRGDSRGRGGSRKAPRPTRRCWRARPGSMRCCCRPAVGPSEEMLRYMRSKMSAAALATVRVPLPVGITEGADTHERRP